MPYLITVRTPIGQNSHGRYLYDRSNHPTPDVSRCATLTLEDAVTQIGVVVAISHGTDQAAIATRRANEKLRKRGGLVLLSNGLRFEVAEVDWSALARDPEAHWAAIGRSRWRGLVIDNFNRIESETPWNPGPLETASSDETPESPSSPPTTTP